MKKERPIRIGQFELPPYTYLESINPFLVFIPSLIFPEIFGFFYWTWWGRRQRTAGSVLAGGGIGEGAAGGGGGAR